MLRKKPSIEKRKGTAERDLAARKEALASKGVPATDIERDTVVRHLKAKIRQARRQLEDIARQERWIEGKAESKAEEPAG
jgi:hypothetical protein